MLNQDYKEMLQLFEKHQVSYIVIGAYALAAHGFPRSTGDIDLWVKPDLENSKKVFIALAEFGAPLREVSEETFNYKGIVFQIGVAPCRIDIITQISGDIDFDDAFNCSVEVEIDGLRLRILGVEQIIKNKMATGRPKDLEDVEFLRKRQS